MTIQGLLTMKITLYIYNVGLLTAYWYTHFTRVHAPLGELLLSSDIQKKNNAKKLFSSNCHAKLTYSLYSGQVETQRAGWPEKPVCPVCCLSGERTILGPFWAQRQMRTH